MSEQQNVVGREKLVEKTGERVPPTPRSRGRGTKAAKGHVVRTDEAEIIIPDAAPIRREGQVYLSNADGDKVPDLRPSCEEGHMSGVDKTTKHIPDSHPAQEDGHVGLSEKDKSIIPSSCALETIPFRERAAQIHAEMCALLMALQKRRLFAIKMQSKLDRGTDAYLATQRGYHTGLSDKERKKIFDDVRKARAAIEKGGEDQISGIENDRQRLSLSASEIALVLAAAQARLPFDAIRKEAEADMERIAKTLPVWQWCISVRGIGAKGLAIIVGEAGDLGAYPKKGHLWKRLGLAVIDGERQRRKTDVEAAAAHGYNPRRRAEMWVLADSMFRSQWRGATETEPAHAIGPYGEAYERRRAVTASREGWTPAHQNADARRYMFKHFVKHLRAAWIAA